MLRMVVSAAAAILAVAALAQAQTPAPEAAPAPTAPPVRELARNVYLLPGGLYENRGPDGNTVLFTGSNGLVVVDTGRHVWHSDAIAAFARERNKPVVAIFNTHWHLDHSSGNRRLTAIWPNAPVYTTTAVDRATGEGGFLTRSFAQARERMNDPAINGTQREEMVAGLATWDARESLRPTRVVSHDERVRLVGRSIDVRVTNKAVTDADLWLYDRKTHIAVIGDLVTLPAPFFETACPQHWSEALDAVWATPFTTVIPGHGDPMTRAQFDTYRGAFNAFMACVNSTAEPATCAESWATAVDPLLTPPTFKHEDAIAYARYYVGFLRRDGGKSASCLPD